MDSKQLTVARCLMDVRDAESRLREARLNLEHGFTESMADLDKAKAVHERKYGQLKEEVSRAEAVLEKEKAYLANAEAELEKGFES